ncbi:uncharacterized protein DFL_001921 [Arthrobotrys flagrans]|uniref:Uncharacterized protein n=1 Tax=Arthrobotrys flagrans TaxID=97331 RepID=A0A437AA20_ARTFL|nr:hypothetical protein DFL_001921 [Arthrobotrys flagrans]
MPKRPRPPPSRRKKTPKAPETADEYLAVAVELEESGERWRSGDVAKAGRFFVQAITAYESTLVRYPNNFDARYNRARLLYTLTQLPLPATFFPQTSTPESRLLAAAEAHRECNDLEKNSSDILFNYGQTLNSLGEFHANKPQDDVDDDGETPAREIERLLQSKQAFENSWAVLQQCLVVQEGEYKSTLEQSQSFDDINNGEDDMDDDDGGVKPPPAERRNSTASSQSSNSGGGGNATQWASILEPTTKLSILDTALTMLEVQTNILTLSTPSTATTTFSKEYLEQITTHANTILTDYILPIAGKLHEEEEYAQLGLEVNEVSEKEIEATLSRTNFLTALAETKYHLGLSTLETWEEEVKSAFEPFTLYPPSSSTGEYKGTMDLTTSWMALCDRSTAYTTLSTALLPTNPSKSWKLLSTISSPSLSSATKLAPEKEKPGIYLARGNLELLRSRIPIEAAQKGKEVLLKNAGVYYRGVAASAASGLIGAVDGVKIAELVEEAKVKEAVIKLEQEGDWEPLKGVVGGGVGRETVGRVVRGAVEDGVFGREVLGVIEERIRG